MPNYDFLYFNPDGTVASKVEAKCADDREAKIMAHALKDKGFKRIKVLTGEENKHLVYQRPMTGEPLFHMP